MATVTINTDRPALELVRGGETTRWEYDILSVQLEIDRLEALHKLRVDGKVKPPTVAFLADMAAALVLMGLDGCAIDTAMRVYSMVTVQFRQLATSLAAQVAELSGTT